jgi:hypothetical protein
LMFATNRSCLEATFARAVHALCFLRTSSSMAHLTLPCSGKFRRVANRIDRDRPRLGTAKLTLVEPLGSPEPHTNPNRERASVYDCCQRDAPARGCPLRRKHLQRPLLTRRVGINALHSVRSARLQIPVLGRSRPTCSPELGFRRPSRPRAAGESGTEYRREVVNNQQTSIWQFWFLRAT